MNAATRTLALLLALAPLAAACAPATATRQPAVGAPSRVPVPRGLEAVIGHGAGDLVRLFGTPRLDVQEGDARKLQFSGDRCVLDAYLYPERPGSEPVATHVDARRSDGLDVDRAACIAALRR